MSEIPDALERLRWLEPWHSVPATSELEEELAREVGPMHVLAGRRAVAVGRRQDNDDVLFFLPDGPEPLAVVHLTWAGRQERVPNCPRTRFYRSVEAFVTECLEPDHRDFV